VLKLSKGGTAIPARERLNAPLQTGSTRYRGESSSMVDSYSERVSTLKQAGANSQIGTSKLPPLI
jgi:hypothetical protein